MALREIAGCPFEHGNNIIRIRPFNYISQVDTALSIGELSGHLCWAMHTDPLMFSVILVSGTWENGQTDWRKVSALS